MTNLERLRKMKPNELIIFLKMCDFNRTCPLIEGRRFHTDQEIVKWFYEDASKPIEGQNQSSLLSDIFYRTQVTEKGGKNG